MKDKLITLLQTIINKIKGLQMTAPVPQEEYVEYLEDMIAVVNDADLDVPNELPAVAAGDKGKFLHTNESTGALEWAEGGSGGGVLVVHDEDGTLDKTWQEIHDAIVGGMPCFVMEDEDGITIQLVTAVFIDSGSYYAAIGEENTGSYNEYTASSADDYPTVV